MKITGMLLALIVALGLTFVPAEAQTNVWHFVNGILRGPGFVTTGSVTIGGNLVASGGVTASSQFNGGTGGYLLNNVRFISGTAPTISSGFGTSPSVVASNGTAAFTINVGTGGTASSGVIGLPTATTGWRVTCDDVTTQSATVFLTKQTATSTTSATVGNFDAAGAAAAWVASNILVCSATAY